jgi:hypothetical protein
MNENLFLDSKFGITEYGKVNNKPYSKNTKLK